MGTNDKVMSLVRKPIKTLLGIPKKVIKEYHLVGVLLIAIGGFIHTTIIPTHVDSIVLLYSQSIGFYMFTVVLLSIINVFNAVNFNKHRSFLMLLAVYVVSGALIFSTLNYINITFFELTTIDTVSLTRMMYYSVVWMYVVMATTIVGNLLATLSYINLKRVKS